MEHAVKLNARGTIMYVDEAILAKSSYFKHLLTGEVFSKSEPNDDDSYYVDCDIDVLTEIVAYMETGHFKYKQINSKYLEFMLIKYGIDVPDIKAKTHDINDVLESVVKHVGEEFRKQVDIDQITVRFIGCVSDKIEFITLKESRKYIMARRNELIACRYDYEKYNLRRLTTEGMKSRLYKIINGQKLNDVLYLLSVRGISTVEFVFERIKVGTNDDMKKEDIQIEGINFDESD